MADSIVSRIARRLFSLERKHEALARTRQLPSSSVKLADGAEINLAQAAEQAADATRDLSAIDGHLGDLDGLTDGGAVVGSVVPEWVTGAGASGDAGVDSALAAYDRAKAAKTVADLAAEDALQAAIDSNAALAAVAETVASIAYEYATSANPTAEPSTGWSFTVPSWSAGSYVWRRAVITHYDQTVERSSAELVTGNPGAPGSDGAPGEAGDPGEAATSVQVGNDNVAISCTAAGATAAASSFTVPFAGRFGTARVAAVAVVGSLPSGITLGSNTAATVSADGALVFNVANGSTLGGTLSGSIEVTITARGQAFTHIITWTKALAGAQGSPGTPGTPGAPGADGRGVTGAEVRYQAGVSGTTAPTGTWNTAVPTVAAGQYLWTRTVTSYTSGTPTTTYSVSRQGENGANGTPGDPGADGATSYLHVAYANSADGATNFSTTDPSGRAYMGTYTDFTEADSTNPAAYTWALIKGADGSAGTPGTPGDPGPAGKGIASSVVNYASSTNGTTAPSTGWNTTIPTVAEGSFLWTRTVITFTDAATTTTYSVARQGANGADGADGATGGTGPQGNSVSTITRYYRLAASTPAAPANPPASPWTTAEPSYTPGSTNNLYFVDRTVLTGSGGSSITAVQLSSTYAAAKAAYNAAAAAQLKADGIYNVIPSTTQPTTAPGGGPLKAGDQWWVIGTGINAGKFTGVRVYNGSTWDARQLVADSILVPSSVGNVLIADGAIDGKTITGAMIRTAASGQRLELNANGLSSFNAAGTLTNTLSADELGMRITGPTGAVNINAQMAPNVFVHNLLPRATHSFYGHASLDVPSTLAGSTVTHTSAGMSARVGGDNKTQAHVSLAVYADDPSAVKVGAVLATQGAQLAIHSPLGVNIEGNSITLDAPTVTFQRDTDGWQPLPGNAAGAYGTGVAEYLVRAGWVQIRIQFTTSAAPGSRDYWQNLPAWLCPTNNVQGSAWLGGGIGAVFLRPNGTIAISNSTGGTLNGLHVTFTYPLEDW